MQLSNTSGLHQLQLGRHWLVNDMPINGSQSTFQKGTRFHICLERRQCYECLQLNGNENNWNNLFLLTQVIYIALKRCKTTKGLNVSE